VTLQVPELVVRARAALQSANAELLAAEGGHELLRITHGNALSGATSVKQEQQCFVWAASRGVRHSS
jgi:hypothetical protein